MFIKLFVIAFPVFLVIDLVWLNFIAKNFYSKQIGFLLVKNPNLSAAFIFYLIFVTGLIFFVVMPAIDKKIWSHALLAGAFFGLVTYATYDLTNLATVRNWPFIITIVDLGWGMILSASVSLITYFIALKSGL